MFLKNLRALCGIMIGISVVFAGLGLTLAFGLFAFIGIPVLVVGLGMLSAAIEEVT